MKKHNRIQLTDIAVIKRTVDGRPLSPAELKMVAGGNQSEGGTSSDSGDTDA